MSKRNPHPIIDQIVARHHVGESYLAICRKVKQAMKKSAWRKLDRATRSMFIDDAIYCHTENRNLYTYVMGGHR